MGRYLLLYVSDFKEFLITHGHRKFAGSASRDYKLLIPASY